MADLQKLLETSNKRLSHRADALRHTLEEIKIVESLEKAEPGAYTHALTQLYTKRDRQHTAVAASEQYMKGLTQAIARATKRA